ncbi:ATP-binding protein [Gillisia sp. M10.2A]|uniref:histidine kinase n=1 Tax=Gillisia lutea TaxID=2909668 RepID=A0ABS9EFL4_9FLAO|nr:ATP-binding protein [Gillisia lutea]MCF4101661.1 ATP-binding protein [Gillisia lutea]
MKIRNKLILGFGIIISILIAEIILNQLINQKANTTYQKLKVEALPTLYLLDQYKAINKELFLLTSNKVYNINSSLSSQNRLKGIIEVELPYLKSELAFLTRKLEKNEEIVLQSPEIIDLTNEIILLGEKLDNILITKEDYQNPVKLQQAYHIIENDFSRAHSALNLILEGLDLQYSHVLEEFQDKFSQDLTQMSNIILITGIIGILIGLSIAFLVIQSISKPLVALNNAALAVSKGNYDNVISIEGKGELATLGKSFNIMTTSLKENFKLIEKNNEHIKQQEKRFRKVIEASPSAIILTNAERKIELANLQAEVLFKYSKRELIGKSIEDLIATKELESGLNFKDDTNKLKPLQEFYALDKFTNEIPVEVRLNKITIDNKEMTLASVVDITQRKTQEIEINKYLEQLKFKNKELEQFSYITSHDLQEPLKTVVSFINLIDIEYKDSLNDNLATYFNYIRGASNRMSMLINGLLEYSRIGHSCDLDKVDLNELLSGIYVDLSHKIKNSNAQVTSQKLPEVRGYKLELRLLFQNLITNAVKFRRSDVVPSVNISFTEDSHNWIFHIKDNGIGIKEELQNKIFVIFQRLHHRNTYEGTGIGLAHCKKIIELHQGKIWLTSNPGKGCIFSFNIPKNLV